MDDDTLREKDPSSIDVSIDMTAKRFIPSQNPSTIHLKQVPEDSIVSLENKDAANAGSAHGMNLAVIVDFTHEIQNFRHHSSS